MARATKARRPSKEAAHDLVSSENFFSCDQFSNSACVVQKCHYNPPKKNLMISVTRGIKFPNKSINNFQRMKKSGSRFIGGLKAQCCIYSVCPPLTVTHRLLYIDFVHNLYQI